MGFLEEKARQVRARRAVEAPRDAALLALHERARAMPPRPSLESGLRDRATVGLIAEFKRKSPSAGALAGNGGPDAAARLYEVAGAAAISVLTDEADFGGSLGDLEAAAGATGLPVLRKDFLVDAAGLYEARLAGAAAALLIMRILTAGETGRLIRSGREVGLECLVEVHDEDELANALDSGASLIGINNRDLETLRTDLRITERLAPRVPEGITVVSESGIRTPDDVVRVRDAGAHAVLVGEVLMKRKSEERLHLAADLAGVTR